MPCSCGPTSGCKTSRCECHKAKRSCNESYCKCNPKNCTNYSYENSDEDASPKTISTNKIPSNSFTSFRETKKYNSDDESDNEKSDFCSCGPTSGCKTNKCKCNKNGKYCDSSNCECSIENCTNKNKSAINVKPTNPSKSKSEANNYPRDDFDREILAKNLLKKPVVEVYDFASDLIKNNRLRKTFKKGELEDVLDYRNGIDLYTNDSRNTSDKYEIDHIVEIQMLAHATAKQLYNKASVFNKLEDNLKDSINVIENYNVTELPINKSKGTVFRSFLHDKMYEGYPFLSLMIGTKCEKYMGNIRDAFICSYDSVVKNIRESRYESGISDNSKFENIAEEMETIFHRMKLEEDDDIGRVLRNRKN